MGNICGVLPIEGIVYRKCNEADFKILLNFALFTVLSSTLMKTLYTSFVES
jgi:hypothetical protein